MKSLNVSILIPHQFSIPMKAAILFLLFSLLSLSLWGKCETHSLEFWPEGPLIQQHAFLMITGNNEGVRIVNDLKSEEYAIYLASSEDKVYLEMKDIFNGLGNKIQATFHPRRPLRPGQTYSIYIECLAEEESFTQRWNAEKGAMERIHWRVDETVDEEAPRFASPPKEVEQSLQMYGCGEERYIQFEFEAEETSEYLVKVVVLDWAPRACMPHPSQYYLTPYKSSVCIGRGMCGGDIYLEKGHRYDIRFWLIDQTGLTSHVVFREATFDAEPLSWEEYAKKHGIRI